MVNGAVGSPVANVVRWRLLLGNRVVVEETLVTHRTGWAVWRAIVRWNIAGNDEENNQRPSDLTAYAKGDGGFY